MKKWTILDENYMALEQQVAQALDTAEQQVKGHLEEMMRDLDDIFEALEEGGDFHTDPAFLNFKSEARLTSLAETVKNSLMRAARKCKDKDEVELLEAALMSKAEQHLNEVDIETFDSEIHELLSFFGFENAFIPDSEEGEFKVKLKDEAHTISIKKLTDYQGVADAAGDDLTEALSSGQTKDKLYSALRKLVLLKELAESFK
jgi:predicted ATPase